MLNSLVVKSILNKKIESSCGSDDYMTKENPTGTGSLSMNRHPTANIGANSTAEGFKCEASGASSHAEGDSTTASGQASHAEGKSTKASGYYSHAEGVNTKASSYYSHAEGFKCEASGYYSHAEGSYTTASGNASHAEGTSCIATAQASHAEGDGTTASERNSHAEGDTTTASGEGSHAEGFKTKASGPNSHAEGAHTEASGYYSHAEGLQTKASGSYSHSGGNSTIAGYRSQTAIGEYNDNKKEDIFEVGNGTSNTARSNALALTKTGDLKIGGKYIDGSGNVLSMDSMQSQTTTNLLKPTLETTTDNGVTCTNNGDGTFTIDTGGGTTTTQYIFGLRFDIKYSNFTNKDLKLIGCPNGGTEATYDLELWDEVNQKTYFDFGNGVIIPKGTTITALSFVVRQGQTVSNLVFKPMLTTNLSASYDDFVKYTGDTGSLNSDVADVVSRVDETETDIQSVEKQVTANGCGEVAGGKNKVNIISAKSNCNVFSDKYVTSSSMGSYGIFEINIDSNISGNCVLSFEAKLDSGSSSVFNTVGIIDINGSYDVSTFTNKPSFSSQYQKYSVTFNATKGNYKTILFQVSEDTSSAVISVRNIQIEEGSTATEYEPYYPSNKMLAENVAELEKSNENKMDKENPTGTGAFSMNRKADTTVGENSTTEGNDCTASGNYSHAEGLETNATQERAHAEGYGTNASGYQAHTEGHWTVASGQSSHAEGESTLAQGYETHAEGNGTKAIGNFCHVEGHNTTALSDASHSEGSSTNRAPDSITSSSTNDDIISSWNSSKFSLAKGTHSHVEGCDCLALGDGSHAEGARTKAVGDMSHSGGCATEATGRSSCAIGEMVSARYDYQTAIGILNHNKEENIFEVGNGISDSTGIEKSNALELTRTGDLTIQGDCTFTDANGNKISMRDILTRLVALEPGFSVDVEG